MAHKMRRPRRRRAFLPFAAVFVLLVLAGSFLLHYFPAPIFSADTTIHFIDVGQGDCTLFLSEGQAVLIDAGPAEMGERVVSYLASQGVTRLRAVIATHPHADHIGSMSTILAAFPVDTFYTTGAVHTTRTYENLLHMVEAQGVSVLVPTPGERLELDSGAFFRFLSPPQNADYDNLNNTSIVCMFEANGTRVLMMGDAEAPVEQDLLDSGADIRCHIIRLGHHGSATSSGLDFLKATHAHTAIISCGADNDYGHPHQQTLVNLNAAVIRDVRSTEKGTIVITLPKAKENAA